MHWQRITPKKRFLTYTSSNISRLVSHKYCRENLTLQTCAENASFNLLKLWNAHCASNGDESGEWNPSFYAHYIRTHAEKFANEGIREKLNMISTLPPSAENSQINTYYGNLVMRCVPVLDFLNNRYIELGVRSSDAESLLDNLNVLYKFHNNPISYVYNTFMYYDNKFRAGANDATLSSSKKRRLFNIVAANQLSSMPQFTPIFKSYLASLSNDPAVPNPDISNVINIDYYYYLIQRLVRNILLF